MKTNQNLDLYLCWTCQNWSLKRDILVPISCADPFQVAVTEEVAMDEHFP